MARKNSFTSEVDAAVGVKVRELRVLTGLSREQLGKKIDVSQQQLQKYERGTNRITVGRLAEIARALGKPMSYFVEGIETPVVMPSAHQRMCIEVSRNFLRVKNPMHQNALNMLTRTLADA